MTTFISKKCLVGLSNHILAILIIQNNQGDHLHFNEYLKTCRERYDLTQEQLVQELYNSDDEFLGLNTGTLSRWERGATHPSISKQVGIIKVLQKYSTHLFPCFYDQDNIAEIGGISNFEEGIKLVSNMNLQYHSHYITDDNVKIKGYRQTLPNVLASEHVVKMLLSKQDCPEE